MRRKESSRKTSIDLHNELDQIVERMNLMIHELNFSHESSNPSTLEKTVTHISNCIDSCNCMCQEMTESLSKISHFTQKENSVRLFLSDQELIDEILEYTKDLVNSDEDSSEKATDDNAASDPEAQIESDTAFTGCTDVPHPLFRESQSATTKNQEFFKTEITGLNSRKLGISGSLKNLNESTAMMQTQVSHRRCESFEKLLSSILTPTTHEVSEKVCYVHLKSFDSLE